MPRKNYYKINTIVSKWYWKLSFIILLLVFLVPNACASEKYNIYLKDGRTLKGYQLYKSKKDPSIFVAKKKGLRIEIKKNSIDSYKKITTRNSNSQRPIGTVVLDGNSERRGTTATAWQIVTTNNIVAGYFGFVELDTGNVIGGKDTIDRGVYNRSSGYMTLEHHYFKYKYIQEGFTVISNTFKIQGNKVIDKKRRVIGTFYPNKFLLNKNVSIPKREGCTNIWGNSQNKIYYTRSSIFFKNKPYPQYVRFFCSKQEAVNAGYKESLR